MPKSQKARILWEILRLPCKKRPIHRCLSDSRAAETPFHPANPVFSRAFRPAEAPAGRMRPAISYA
jgi:hypothetical protein